MCSPPTLRSRRDIDLFQPPMLEKYLAKTASNIQLPFEELLKLGRLDQENPAEPLNMAVLAMENANYVNGVSKLHAEVSREMFHPRWENYPIEEVPTTPSRTAPTR